MTLPTGNPVVSGTAITPTWANTTLSDIEDELTDSKSRSGKGDFTAPARCANGSVAAPSFAFTNDTGVGMYRKSSGTGSLAAGGSDIATFDSTGLYIGTGISPVPSNIPATVYRTANQSTTSSTEANVTDLSFSVVASGVYEFEAVLSVSRAGTGTNFIVDFNGPAAPTSIQYMGVITNAGTLGFGNATAFGDNIGLLQGVTLTTGVFSVKGVLVNGANAGTVALRFASSDNATSISILRGSLLRYQRLA